MKHGLAAVLLMVLSAIGCHAPGPPDAKAPRQASTTRAASLTDEAVRLLIGNPTKARELLEQAIALDPYHGPAHNNLGVLLLDQGELFNAANAFEWAAKLLVGHPDPRLNLGLVYERAGITDRAFEAYEMSLSVRPDHLPTVQALASLSLRERTGDARLTDWLSKIALNGTSQEWRQWAKKHRRKEGRIQPTEESRGE